MIVVGVDPGTGGGIAAVNLEGMALMLAEAIPVFRHKVGNANRSFIDGAGVAGRLRWLGLQDDVRVYVERVHAMPKQGVVSTWNFGQAYGTVLGVVAALGLPLIHVTPHEWKQGMRLGRGATKDDSRQKAIDLFPRHRALFARKLDHNRAEATLIACYGASQETAK